MYHCVTIRAYRTKVGDRINFVMLSDFGKLAQVVNVDKSIHSRSVDSTERESTDVAVGSIFLDAFLPRKRIPLIGIDEPFKHRTFWQSICFLLLNFIREHVDGTWRGWFVCPATTNLLLASLESLE